MVKVSISPGTMPHCKKLEHQLQAAQEDKSALRTIVLASHMQPQADWPSGILNSMLQLPGCKRRMVPRWIGPRLLSLPQQDTAFAASWHLRSRHLFLIRWLGSPACFGVLPHFVVLWRSSQPESGKCFALNQEVCMCFFSSFWTTFVFLMIVAAMNSSGQTQGASLHLNDAVAREKALSMIWAE